MTSFLNFVITITILMSQGCFGKTKYPNFVMILADDMGWGDPTYNNGTAATPYLDEWTRSPNTITFWRGYAGGPVCSPTRASVLSGRTPNRECIYNANGCGSKPAWNCSEGMPFPNSTFTVAEAVKKSNPKYNTAFFGKWHLGDFWVKQKKHGMSNPSSHGFDTWLATEASAPSCTTNCGCFYPYDNCITGHYNNGPWCTSYWYPNVSSPIGVSNISYKIPGEDTVYLVDQFEQWLNGTDLSEPFLVLLFLHPVHVEFLATPEWREACSNGTTCPILANNKKYSSAQLDYFGDLSSMDVQIKRIRDLLSQYNVIDNTLIWFTSDNGPEGDGAGPYGNSDWPGSPNGLRGRKRDVWEGGIREPTIIQFNGYISNKKGFNSSYPIVTYDLLPTIMDILNVESDKPSWQIDGTSLLPLFEDPVHRINREKPMGWVFESGHAWTNNTYKIVVNSHDCKNAKQCAPALYDLTNDPSETNNLTAKYPDIYKQLFSDMTAWLNSVNNSQYFDSGCAINKTQTQ